jgi:hypothetical protein
MRVIKRILLTSAIVIAVCLFMTVCVCAEEQSEGSALHSLMSGNSNVAINEVAVVSYALDVIAYQNQMTVAGIKGNALNFSSDRFACAMNLSQVDHIIITKLPDATCGSLYIGSQSVSVNQKISSGELSLLTYEETGVGTGGNTSFEFRVNGSAYDVVCNIFMIDELNYSPTLSMASYISLNNQTYRDVKIDGVLSAYDPEGDSITFEIVKYPSHGRVVLEDNKLGVYTYIPATSYTGTDSFDYVVFDKYGNYSASATVSITVSAQSTSTVYSDMQDDPAYSHAIAMTEKGLMNGIRVGDYFYFEADREVSRSEFVVTAMNALGIKNVPTATSTGFYDDADISEEMKGYIALAYSKGYISGIKADGNIYFRPDETIKLSEAAVIVSNMIGYAKAEVAPVFADADSIPSWSSEAIESLYTLGVLELPDKTVGANEIMTRGYMAKLLNKAMQIMGK